MNRQTTARFAILAFGTTLGLVVAIVAGSVPLVLLLSPAVALVTVASLVHRWPDLDVEVTAPARAVEGDTVDVTVAVESKVGAPWVEVAIEVPPDMEPIGGIRNAVVRVPAGRRVAVDFPVVVTRWGVAVPGRVHVVARDRFGLFVSRRVVLPRLAVRVHPRDGNRRSMVVPRRLRTRVGIHASRRAGEGTDFAEVRPFRIGDDARALNWRVSARRGEPWVTVRHPDESGDLVFLLDSFTDIGPEGNRLVQRAVRAVMSLAEANLGVHDRVGLLDVGRHIRWYRPRLGRLHRARLFDALLEIQAEPGLRAPSVAQLPLHELDAGTMVVVITGLLDEDMARLPVDLRQRGLEVAVVQCALDEHVAGSADERDDAGDALALRLWRLQLERRRRRLVDHGVNVVRWDPDQPLELPIAGLARQAVGR
ncbi:MAG: DUF58 domain-containing protein [Acidimicrobiales bacterium]